MDEHRRRIYRIPECIFLDMLSGKRSLNLPQGTKIRSLWRDFSVDPDYFHETGIVFCLSVEHPSFDPVDWRVPIIDVIERKPARLEIARVKSAAK